MKENQPFEAMLSNSIINTTFTTLPSGKTIVCELTLDNGFTVIGKSSRLSTTAHDEKIGQDDALFNAKTALSEIIAFQIENNNYYAEINKTADDTIIETDAEQIP